VLTNFYCMITDTQSHGRTHGQPEYRTPRRLITSEGIDNLGSTAEE